MSCDLCHVHREWLQNRHGGLWIVLGRQQRVQRCVCVCLYMCACVHAPAITLMSVMMCVHVFSFYTCSNHLLLLVERLLLLRLLLLLLSLERRRENWCVAFEQWVGRMMCLCVGGGRGMVNDDKMVNDNGKDVR